VVRSTFQASSTGEVHDATQRIRRSVSLVCTIIFAWNCLPTSWRTSLVLAANRDELRSRPSLPPDQLSQEPPLWGGRDVLAGGTWLAVDARARVAAVTNRHPGGVVPTRDPKRQSRGALPTAVLGGDDEAARAFLEAVAPASYNPVNALYLGWRTALLLGLDDSSGARLHAVARGVHVLGERDLDDASPKTQSLLEQARTVVATAASPRAVVAGFRELLASHTRHGLGPQTAACIHEEDYGTVSSATVVITAQAIGYEHAEGPPCTAVFSPVQLA
jgi:uncharacterized protein with NRDE domain